MKHKKIFEVTTESYEEEQYLLNEFPHAWWTIRNARTVFNFPIDEEPEVRAAINEYEERKKK